MTGQYRTRVTTDDETDRLVERAKLGEGEAFAALYDRFAERVYRFVRFRVGGDSDAEDLLQLTFLKMIEALPRYQPRGVPFAAWLFRLARNATIDFERTRRQHASLDEAMGRPSDAPGPDELAGAALDRHVLDRALRDLTREQQEVIACRFFAGLTAREIGTVMGKREGTVRGLQFRALDALRRRLRVAPTESAGPAPEPTRESAES